MSYAVPGLVMADHELTVPLDHSDPNGEQITIFAREVCEPEGRAKPYLRGWVTSEYDHNGVRVEGERILGRLIDLVRGRA